ncbi:MAG: flagellar basal body rod protein FlgB [Phycisphaerales bacterium JB038]
MITGVTDIGALPVLEQTLRFTGARHRLVLHNIANLDTPNYQPHDVDPAGFREALAAAVEERRESGRNTGPLHLKDTRQIEFGERLELNPRTPSGNILFHDRNNRDLERTMQGLAENAMTFRAAADMYRSRMNLVHTAISERVG